MAAIIAVGISLYSSYDIYAKARPSKGLAVEVVYSTSIISPDEIGTTRFEFQYEGNRIDCASVLGVRIENVGNVPIPPDDFVSPINIAVPPPGRILVSGIEYVEPQSLQPEFIQTQTSEVTLELG